MKINHNIIRGIIKWTSVALFVLSIFFKLKKILIDSDVKGNTDDGYAVNEDSYEQESYEGYDSSMDAKEESY